MQCQGLNHNCRNCKTHYANGTKVEKCTQCGADMHCTQEAVSGYRYCIHHGGPQPKYGWYGNGRAPVTGHSSSSRLVRLASRQIQLTQDGRFLSNRHSMEIVWTRIQQLVDRIEDNTSPEQLTNLYKLWVEFRDLDTQGKRVEAVQAKGKLDLEFQRVYHDYASWQQLFDAVDLYRKMTESEVKIAKDLKAIMTAEDGMELVSQLLAVVIQVVNDSNQLKRIIYEFRKLVGESADRVEEGARSRSGRGSGEVIDA